MRFPQRRNDTVIHDNPCTGLKSRDQRSKDHDGVLVRPVVQDQAEEVYVRVLYGLRAEEIVALKFDSAL